MVVHRFDSYGESNLTELDVPVEHFSHFSGSRIMGYSSALDFASQASLPQAVSWHLQANCYPPVPQYMVGVCIQAIELCASEEHLENVRLPEGVIYCNGYLGTSDAPAYKIVENFHLEAFVDYLLQDSDDGEEGL